MITLCMAMVMFTGRLLLGKAELHLMSPPPPGLLAARRVILARLHWASLRELSLAGFGGIRVLSQYSYSIINTRLLEPTRRPAASPPVYLVFPIGVPSARLCFIGQSSIRLW